MRLFVQAGVIIALVVAIVACGGSGQATEPATATSQSQDESASSSVAPEDIIVIQYANITRTVPTFDYMAEYSRRITERTNGRVEIQMTSFAELGLAGPDTLRLIGDRTPEFGEVYSGYVGGDHPIVDITNLWGLFDDTETHLEAINAVRDEVIWFVEEASGGKLLHFNYYAHNYVFSKKSVQQVSDFEGLRIRQHCTVLGDLVQSLGGEGQFVPFAEVYAALERGILDAAVTEGLAGNGQRWYEVTDYLVGPIISLGNTWVVINQERWDTLPPDIQQIFLEESERHDRELLAYAIGEWEQKAIDDNVADGLIHQEFSPEIKRALKDAAINQVIPQWVKRAGGPDSEAAKLFNDKLSPIVNVRILPDGTAEEF